jgi:hypothetical protein
VVTAPIFRIRDLAPNILDTERQRVSRLFEKDLSFASLREVGSTAARGVVSKQDLDFALRVSANRFYDAQSILDSRFQRGEIRIPLVGYQRYILGSGVDVMIHLVVSNGIYDNSFEQFLRLLITKKTVRDAYNNLKIGYDGRPMSEYRRVKRVFIEKCLCNA